MDSSDRGSMREPLLGGEASDGAGVQEPLLPSVVHAVRPAQLLHRFWVALLAAWLSIWNPFLCE